MQQVAQANKGYKKLLIVTGAIALLMAGYFIYKYTYIYTERKKYDQAAVAIHKVADDLRAQGIETEFSRGCGHTQEVFGAGTLTCSVGITYKGNENLNKVSIVSKAIEATLIKYSFSVVSSNTTYSISPSPSGSKLYKLNNSILSCQLIFDSTWPDNPLYAVIITCNGHPRYKIF